LNKRKYNQNKDKNSRVSEKDWEVFLNRLSGGKCSSNPISKTPPLPKRRRRNSIN
jgi:hypothetical protein